MSDYYDWKHSQHTCGGCGWRGLGSEAELRESFNDGAEYECPSCGHYFGYVSYPLLRESLQDPRAPVEDRLFAEIALRGAKALDGAAKPADATAGWVARGDTVMTAQPKEIGMALFSNPGRWARDAVGTRVRFWLMFLVLTAMQFYVVHMAIVGGWSGALGLAIFLTFQQFMFLWALRALLPPRAPGDTPAAPQPASP